MTDRSSLPLLPEPKSVFLETGISSSFGKSDGVATSTDVLGAD
jgi:hypothetical protein